MEGFIGDEEGRTRKRQGSRQDSNLQSLAPWANLLPLRYGRGLNLIKKLPLTVINLNVSLKKIEAAAGIEPATLGFQNNSACNLAA